MEAAEAPLPERGMNRKQRAELEQAQKDMERLALIRERRAAQAKERIAKEGFDRFAPPSSENGPPKARVPGTPKEDEDF